jgi:hypothetical protein
MSWWEYEHAYFIPNQCNTTIFFKLWNCLVWHINTKILISIQCTVGNVTFKLKCIKLKSLTQELQPTFDSFSKIVTNPMIEVIYSTKHGIATENSCLPKLILFFTPSKIQVWCMRVEQNAPQRIFTVKK